MKIISISIVPSTINSQKQLQTRGSLFCNKTESERHTLSHRNVSWNISALVMFQWLLLALVNNVTFSNDMALQHGAKSINKTNPAVGYSDVKFFLAALDNKNHMSTCKQIHSHTYSIHSENIHMKDKILVSNFRNTQRWKIHAVVWGVLIKRKKYFKEQQLRGFGQGKPLEWCQISQWGSGLCLLGGCKKDYTVKKSRIFLYVN